MGITNNILTTLAAYLNRKIQDDTATVSASLDHKSKATGTSVVDTLTGTLTSMMCSFMTVEVKGDSARAQWINAQATDFVNDKMFGAVQTMFNSGDCVTVPIVDSKTKRLTNFIVDAENFNITSQFGGKLYGIQYVVEEYRDKTNVYTLCCNVDFDGSNCIFTLRAARNGAFGLPLSAVPQWADKTPVIVIPNVDRILVARLRSLTVDPANLNAIKGNPLCLGGSVQIDNIKELQRALMTEYQLSEKMVMADKTLFRKDPDSGAMRMPKGLQRLVQPVKNNGNQGELIHDWSPSIRAQEYIVGIEEQKRQLEQAVGLNHGIISQSTVQYENVDNVRRGQQKTVAFMDNNRKNADTYLDDLVYIWNIMANFYQITPMGAYDEPQINWSDRYIENFEQRMNAMIQGEAIGATDAIDYRMFAFREDFDTAKSEVDRIRGGLSTGIEQEVENSLEPTTTDVKQAVSSEVSKTLNGAQTSSLISIIGQYTSKALSLEQAAGIVAVSIGVTKDEAKAIIQGV